MKELFRFDDRLRIDVPNLQREWSEYSRAERMRILELWEPMRGRIPGVVAEFETEINERHQLLQEVEDWDKSVALMDEIADYASRINDLNILFRTQPDADEDSSELSREYGDREK